MTAIDLHIHSTASDGTVSPAGLIQIIEQSSDEAVVALTDHDTTAGIDEFIRAAEKSSKKITVIPGVEISTDYRGEEIHILGLGIDPDNSHLNERLAVCRQSRDNRNVRIIEKMQAAGFDIALSDIHPKKEGAAIARPDIARALLEKGYVSSVQEAFDKYISDDGPFFADRIMPDADTVISLIHEAGGKAVLAHILQYRKHFTDDELQAMADNLTEKGLDGIETYYSGYTAEDIRYIEDISESRGLFRTAGSDFHGDNKRDIRIFTGKGSLNVPEGLSDKILDIIV